MLLYILSKKKQNKTAILLNLDKIWIKMALTLWVWWEFSIIKQSQFETHWTRRSRRHWRWTNLEASDDLMGHDDSVLFIYSHWKDSFECRKNAKMPKKKKKSKSRKLKNKENFALRFLIKGFQTDCVKPKQPRLGRLQPSHAAVTAETPQTQADGQIH